MSEIEIIHPPGNRRLRAAIFDFDGTLSLIRTGWQDVMIPMMVEHLRPLVPGLTPERLRAMIAEDVAKTTGTLTIVQMMGLAEHVSKSGGTPLNPKEYKAEYKRRLLAHIAARRTALVERSAAADSLLVAGSRAMLEGFAARGITLCLASGTDEPEVREEAGLLDIARYFGDDIYGAQDDYEASSKKRVIARLLGRLGAAGQEVVVFGDGFVEIENAKEAGGYAVGVATDEAARSGRVDSWKRERLLRAGADLIIPDFACHKELTALLLG
jgi:phosphoglycolate phosphatase-like HAD superfamily hydrolase